jgi:hypothetical protein
MSFLEPWFSFGSSVQGRKRQMKTVRSFFGMDVHKTAISISIAEDGRSGPIRFLRMIPNTKDEVANLTKRLAKDGELDFCYEASGCGYGIHRWRPSLYLKIENPPYMELVIEAVDESGPCGLLLLSVAHCGTQNGDPMRDPEMCFGLGLLVAPI